MRAVGGGRHYPPRRLPGTEWVSESSWIDTERAGSRRPITAAEVPYLERLGAELRRLRRVEAGLSRSQLAVCAKMSDRQIEGIEVGTRRTRRSTLERIAHALVEGRADICNSLRIGGWPELGPTSDLARCLVVCVLRIRLPVVADKHHKGMASASCNLGLT